MTEQLFSPDFLQIFPALKETYNYLSENRGCICSNTSFVDRFGINKHALRARIDRVRDFLNCDEMVYAVHDEGYVLRERSDNDLIVYIPPVNNNYNLEFLSEKDQEFIYGCRVNGTRLIRRLRFNEISLLAILYKLNSCDPESFVPTRKIATEFCHLKNETVILTFCEIRKKLGKEVSFHIEGRRGKGYRLVVADGIGPSTFPM